MIRKTGLMWKDILREGGSKFESGDDSYNNVVSMSYR